MKDSVKTTHTSSLPPHGDPAKFSDEKRRKVEIDAKLITIFGENYGPKPISIQDYLKKNGPLNSTPASIPIKRLRGGIAARKRREIGELKRLTKIAISAEEKIYFIRKIQEIKKGEKDRVAAKNNKDPIMDKMFNKLFELADKFD